MMFTFIYVLIFVDVFALGKRISFEIALELVSVDEFDKIFMRLWKHDFSNRYRIRMKVI